MINNKNKKGFTLVELLVVVIIVAVLAAIVLPTYQRYVLRSHAGEALNLLDMVKVRQNVTVAKSPSRTYISQAAALIPLTATATEVPSGADLIVNGDYTITLNNTDQCAVVIYKQDNQEKFRFAASYTQPGVACSGSICSSFGSFTTDVASVCDIPTEPGPNCTRPVEGCALSTMWSNAACACVSCPNTCLPPNHWGNDCMCLSSGCVEQSCQPGEHFDPDPEVCACVPDECPACLSNKIRVPTEEDRCNCECPPALPYWNASLQICEEQPEECTKTCEGDEVLNDVNCSCSCPSDKPISGDNHTCKDCGDLCGKDGITLTWNGSTCVGTCEEGYVWSQDSNSCVTCYELYGASKPLWVASNSTISDDNLCSVKSGSCEPCPASKPIWDGRKCLACYELKTSTLISQYGNGPIYQNGRCVSCYEAYGSGAPVWSSTYNNCISCAQANPARVRCSSGSGNGGGTGVIGLGPEEKDEYGMEEYLGTSLPIRFKDFLEEYNSGNINAYAYKAGALLAGLQDPDTPYCTGRVEVETQYINTTPQCSAQGQTAPCRYNCPASTMLFPVDPWNPHPDACGANIINGGWDSCFCDPGMGRFVCPQYCDTVPSGVYDVQVSPPNCTQGGIVTCQNQIQSLGTQGDCYSTWHGAASYVPAKPKWVVDSSNTTTGGYCAPCGEVSVTPCSQSSQDCGITRDAFSGSVWNGSSCVTLNNYQIYGNQCLTFSGRPMVKCEAQYSDSGNLLCKEAYYWGCNYDDTNYTCNGSNCRKKTSAATNVQAFLGSCEYFKQVAHGPYNKAYYAVSKLGINEGLIGDVITE